MSMGTWVVLCSDAKLYGFIQIVDEARYSEVFSRSLHEKLGYEYPHADSTVCG